MAAEVREGTPAAEDGGASSAGIVSPFVLPELFDCCVCLDLIYKPVVLACGHISCFWCVHRAMSGIMESHCPICRKPYKHFPAICHLLHNLLWKLMPVDYKRREDEVLESEKETNCFSPRFIGDATSQENATNLGRWPAPDSNDKPQSSASTHGEVSIADALCAGCKQLLFRPAVLNCGHAYCELCVMSLMKEGGRCKICGAIHPGDQPQVCLPFIEILEMIFPQEYEVRRASIQPGIPSGAVQVERLTSRANENLSRGAAIHYWVGCDYCGMYPIMGKRYKCIDCKEKMGFDLCESCYEGRSNFAARFSQQHTPDHTFEVYESVDFYRAWPSIHSIQFIVPDDEERSDAP